jgi:hypothetical protein
MAMHVRMRRAGLGTVGALLIGLVVALPARADAPLAAITAPAADAVLTGTTLVTFTAQADPGTVEVPGVLPAFSVVKLGTTVLTTDPGGDACPAASYDCSGSVSFDAKGLSGTQDLTVTLLDADGQTLVTSAPVAVQGLLPTVEITAPAAGDVAGATAVDVTATTDDTLTEHPASVTFLVGGTPLDTKACPSPAAERSCTVSFAWDATGLVATQDLTASVTTDLGRTVTSAAVTVTPQNPAPTVTIDSPSDVDPVTGTVTVAATATTHAALTEHPTKVELFRDGTTLIGTVTCPEPLLRSCPATFTWDSTYLSSPQTLTAVVTTDLARTAASAPVDYTVSSPEPTATITSPAPGSVTGITDVAVTAATGAGLTDHPVQVELLVNDVVVDTLSCPTSAATCDVTFTRDFTGIASDQSLTARVTTDTNHVVTGPAVVVTPSNPDATVAITPLAASPVTGTVTVEVTATTVESLSEWPSAIELYDGGTLVDTWDCPSPQTAHACTHSFTWDVSGPDRSTNLTARVTTTGARQSASEALAVTVANPAPTVGITSPASGASVIGVVTVAVTASTDAAVTDVPKQVSLYDGATLLQTKDCAGPTHGCVASFSFDRTGTSGSLALHAVVLTTLDVSASSTTVPLTVVDVKPTVTIVSPASGAVVSGTAVLIKATATTAAGRSDFPKSLSLLVDNVRRYTVVCAGTSHACTSTLRWNASKSVGAHRIVVTTTTTRSFTGTSSGRILYAASASRVLLTTPSIVRAGATVTLRGRVIATTTGTGIRGVRVTITRRPALGSATTVRVTTGTGGAFAVSYVVRSNASVRVVTSRLTYLGASSASTRLRASAPMSCSLSTRSLRVGAIGRGSCVVPGLPVGTGLSLRYILNGRISTLASGRSKSTRISFSYGFPRRGTYYLRVDLVANAVYVGSRSALMAVTVS